MLACLTLGGDAEAVRSAYAEMERASRLIAPDWRKAVGLGGSWAFALEEEQYEPWWDEIRAYEAVRARFFAGFADTDWSELVGPADAALLDLGLRTHADDAVARGDFAEAVRAYEFFSEHATRTHFLESIRGYALPTAWIEAYGSERALPRIEALLGKLEEHAALQHLRSVRADLLVALGRLDDARAAYRAVLDAEPESTETRPARHVARVRFRLALLGKPAPPANPGTTWVGGEPEPLGKRPRVLVLSGWSSPDAQRVVQRLAEVRRGSADLDFDIVPLTYAVNRFRLPKSAADLSWDRETEFPESWADCLQLLRERLRWDFPVGIHSDPTYGGLDPFGPACVVIDGEGVVRLVYGWQSSIVPVVEVLRSF